MGRSRLKAASAWSTQSLATSCARLYLATRQDNLPWLFASERQAQLTGQAVNYIVRLAGDKAKLGRVWPHMLRHSCGYYRPTGARIFERCRTTSGTEIPSTRRTTRVLRGIGLRAYGDRAAGFPSGDGVTRTSAA